MQFQESAVFIQTLARSLHVVWSMHATVPFASFQLVLFQRKKLNDCVYCEFRKAKQRFFSM